MNHAVFSGYSKKSALPSVVMLISLTLALMPLTGKTPDKPDKGIMKQGENAFYQKIETDLDAFIAGQKDKPDRKAFTMDFSGQTYPTDMKKYTVHWHNPVESQGATNTCWAFSTLSFLESDLYRLHQVKVKLSQAFVVYQEYLDKATRFIERRGDSYFAEGAEGNSVTRQIRDHGIIPYEIYKGLKPGQPFHDHRALIEELDTYLKGVKTAGNWDLDAALSTVKAILNHHLGAPPTRFEWLGKAYTPLSFRDEFLKLNPDDYVEILSYMQQPYWQRVEYQVPDNWWHDKTYHNVPLDLFMDSLKKAVKSGHTVSIGGDVSEPGYNADVEVGVVPSFDIPRAYIDENARQFRFSNETTTDDHGIHIVGYTVVDGDWWFLIKDSGSGAFNGPTKGYRFIREDYVKLKWMGFTVHKSAVAELLKKFK
jgi:bleomycin hydrolase